MSHPNSLSRDKGVALVIIDVQEAFRTVINDFPTLTANLSVMARAAQLLEIPVIVTEQYPRGLGSTVEEIKFSLPDEFEYLEKTTFSSCGAQGFLERLQARNITQVIVGGIEAHVCVNQTVHDLLDAGYQAHLLTDCIMSRFDSNRAAGLAKMQASGALPSSVEMALFELMRDAQHEQFKAIQALIK